MSEIIIAALFGLLGGAIRASIGILKHLRSHNKTKKFKTKYLITTLIVSAIIGLITSLGLTTNHLINIVIGYAGIDFLESLLKIVKKEN